MKKHIMKISRVTLAVLIATTLASRANNCTAIETNKNEGSHRLTAIVLAIQSHLKNGLNPWCQSFLKSNKQYPALIEEFENHINSFDKDVVEPLQHMINNSTSMPDALTHQAHDIVTDLQNMSKLMHKELQGLIGSQKPAAYIKVMSASKANMTKNLNGILAKLHKLKTACKEQKAADLLKEIGTLEAAIKTFKNQHENAELAVMGQIIRWSKEKSASTY